MLGGGERLLADRDLIARYRAPDRPPLLLAAVRAERVLGADGPELAERPAGMLDVDGVEDAACLALGATAACVERPFADLAPDDVDAAAAALVQQQRVAVWAVGAPGAAALDAGHLRVTALA